MCAIAGVVHLSADAAVLDHMLKTMARRGPDGKGVYQHKDVCLLHTRLSIIDPSGGAQPMVLDQGQERYILSYNGELYNTEELRRELIALGHRFYGRSDTEVLLHGYAQWKEALLEKANGIFAFAVLEEHTGRLFLARDRIGVKPLFYTQVAGGLIFASEIKTILCHPCVKPQLDDDGVGELLLLGPGRTPGSGIFHNMKELEPGCWAVYDAGMLKIHRYWQLRDRVHTDSFEETAERVRELVTDAILAQTVSDVPLGTFLSGGLDSSLISAICQRQAEKNGLQLDTFSVDYHDNQKFFVPGKFQPNADTEYIRLMTDALDSRHHWTVLSPQQLVDALPDSLHARDLPGMADVDSSLLLLCKEIRPYVTVALSGECADEIFGGYPWYRDPAVRSADGFPWAQNTAQRAKYLHPGIRIDAENFVRSRYQQTLSECDILPGNSPLERRMKEMVNLNFRWFMQTLLDRKDRMSMFSALEVRVPFCDWRIAEYLYAVPWEMKDYKGQEKGLLRYAMRGVLPECVLYRKKSPYPKTHHPEFAQLVGDQLRQLLQQKDAPIFQIVSRSALQNLLEGEQIWPWYGQLMRKPQTIVYFLQINRWLEDYSVQII